MRYSRVCRAAWARITQAAPGDAVQISAVRGGSRAAARTKAVAWPHASSGARPEPPVTPTRA
ncbi:DUF2690 domain-containing protein [Streptomyces sp. M19]